MRPRRCLQTQTSILTNVVGQPSAFCQRRAPLRLQAFGGAPFLFPPSGQSQLAPNRHSTARRPIGSARARRLIVATAGRTQDLCALVHSCGAHRVSTSCGFLPLWRLGIRTKTHRSAATTGYPRGAHRLATRSSRQWGPARTTTQFSYLREYEQTYWHRAPQARRLCPPGGIVRPRR